MLNLTGYVSRIDESHVHLTDIKHYGIPLDDIPSHTMRKGRWSKRIKSEGSLIAMNAQIEHKTFTSYDGENRYTSHRITIRQPSHRSSSEKLLADNTLQSP